MTDESKEMLAISKTTMKELAAHLHRWGADELLSKILREVVKVADLSNRSRDA